MVGRHSGPAPVDPVTAIEAVTIVQTSPAGPVDLRSVEQERVTMAGNTTQAGRTVTDKVANLLLVFTEGMEHSLTELSRHANVPTSTTHRLVNELIHLRLLERTPSGRYRASDAFRRMAGNEHPVLDSPAGRTFDRTSWVINDLSRATGRPVRAGVLLHPGRISFLESRGEYRAPAGEFAKMATMPAHPTALGRALLAFGPPSEVEKAVLQGFFPYTSRTLISTQGFRHALAVTRVTGIAVTHGELEVGTCGIAMPVLGVNGQPLVAIEVLVRECNDDPHRIVPSLHMAVRSLARELSGACGRPGDIDGAGHPATVDDQFATYQRERATHAPSRHLPRPPHISPGATHSEQEEELCIATCIR